MINVLVSYAFLFEKNPNKRGDPLFFEEVILELSRAGVIELMIDCGAFTNYHSKRRAIIRQQTYNEITLKDYITACHRYHGVVFKYIGMDSIRNLSATYQNLEDMVRDGLTPMPVFIEGDRLSNLPKLLSINDGWVCVAGGVRGNLAYIRDRFTSVYNYSHQKACIHALGFTRLPDMIKMPLASADSSSWASGARYGAVYTWDDNEGLRALHIEKALKMDTPLAKKLVGSLLSCGIAFRELKQPDSYAGNASVISLPTINSFLNFQYYCRRIGGPKLFLSVPTLGWAASVLSVAGHKKGSNFDYHAALDSYNQYSQLIRAKDLTGIVALARKEIDNV